MPNDLRLVIALPQPSLDEFVGPDALGRLRDAYADVRTLVAERGRHDAWRDAIRAARPHALLTGWGTPAVPEDAQPPLAIVAHTAGSVRGLVSRAMLERGLLVTNWGDAAAPTVAEHALLLTLACLRRLNGWSAVMHQDRGWVGTPMRDEGASLYGRRVGVHGFGAVARQFIRLIAPFGCDVRSFSEGVPAEAFAAHGVGQTASLAELFDGADVVVCAEALNERTRGSVTEPLLRSIAAGGTFVNVGRGAVVDEAALARVAAEGQLQVGLDVFEHEPLVPDSPLRGLANVTLTPHVAGPTRDHRRTCGARAVAALLAFAAGEVVAGAVTPEAFDRST